jgi:hypothetical protein
MKISPVVAEVFHKDEWHNLQTDMIKQPVTFHNFVTVHKELRNDCDLKLCKTMLLFPPRQTLWSSSTKMLTLSFLTIFLLNGKEFGVGLEESVPGSVPYLEYSETMKPAYNGTTRDQNSFCCKQFPFHIGTVSLAIKSVTAFHIYHVSLETTLNRIQCLFLDFLIIY